MVLFSGPWIESYRKSEIKIFESGFCYDRILCICLASWPLSGVCRTLGNHWWVMPWFENEIILFKRRLNAKECLFKQTNKQINLFLYKLMRFWLPENKCEFYPSIFNIPVCWWLHDLLVNDLGDHFAFFSTFSGYWTGYTLGFLFQVNSVNHTSNLWNEHTKTCLECQDYINPGFTSCSERVNHINSFYA